MKTIFITVLMATVTTLATAQNEQSNASVDITCDENNNIVSMGKVVSDSTIKTVYVKKDTKSGKVNSLTVGNNGKNNPLIITRDSKGKVKVEKDMDKISPNTIKSISVYKSNDLKQFAQYGDTSNGVIMVELK